MLCGWPRLDVGLGLTLAMAQLWACDDGSDGGDESGGPGGLACAVEQGPATSAMLALPDRCPKIQLWQGSRAAAPMQSGGPLHVELGVQGAHMFALVVVADGLELPRDPLDFSDPKAPQLTLQVDVPGENAVDGHFTQILRYPLRFETEPQGPAFSRYVPVVLSHSLRELRYLHGAPARIELSLAAAGHGLGEGGNHAPDRALRYAIDVVLDVSL